MLEYYLNTQETFVIIKYSNEIIIVNIVLLLQTKYPIIRGKQKILTKGSLGCYS